MLLYDIVPTEIPFAEVSRDLTELLKEFGPSRKSHHPEYPFWRLQNDGVWVVTADGGHARRQGLAPHHENDLRARLGESGSYIAHRHRPAHRRAEPAAGDRA